MRKIKQKIRGRKFFPQRGATAILMALFVLIVLFLISLTASGIMVLEIKMTRQISDSIPAFYAADAGAEMCLYYARRGGIGNSCFDVGTSITQAVDPAGAMGNGSTYSANRYSDTEIDSTGGFLQTNRSVEVYW